MDSLHIIKINSQKTITQKNLETWKFFVKNLVWEMAIKYARLLIQFTFKNQTLFSASFDEQDEYG